MFLEQNNTMMRLIPIAIVLAFSIKGLSLYFARTAVIKVGGEISGHFVYGHVDTVLNLFKIEKLSSSWNYYFSTSNLSNYTKFIVEKGSIAINGISLTIANVNEENEINIDEMEDETYQEKSSENLLDSFAVNLNEKAIEGKIDPLIGRQIEIQRTIQVLSIIHIS